MSASVTSTSRRDFLKTTSVGVAGTALASTAFSYSRILGANDRVRVAICGVRGRGNDHIALAIEASSARILSSACA